MLRTSAMEKPEQDAGEDKGVMLAEPGGADVEMLHQDARWREEVYQRLQELEKRLQSLEDRFRALPSGIKIPMPTPYCGGTRDRAAYEEWAFTVKNYMKLKGVPKELQVDVALTFVKGTPLLWWIRREERVQKGELPAITDFHVLVKGLGDYFAPEYLNEIAAREARNKLADLQQRGSVKQYCEEFQRISLAIPGMAEGEKVYRFYTGLKEEVARMVNIRTEMQSLQEVMSCAEVFDSIMSYYDNPCPGVGLARDAKQPLVPRAQKRANTRRRTYVDPAPL